jgi:hypothetical protein
MSFTSYQTNVDTGVGGKHRTGKGEMKVNETGDIANGETYFQRYHGRK